MEVYRWDIRVIFDGKPPSEKRFEHARRRDREDGVVITSLFIAYCVEICKAMCVPYMVAAGEADVQVGKQRDGAIAATRDSDLLAYGNKRVILIDNYASQTYRIVDLSTPLTDEVREKYPLYPHYCRHGPRILFVWAAVMGCDITEDAHGIRGVGRESLMAALEILVDENFASIELLALAIHERLPITLKQTISDSDIAERFRMVEEYFTENAIFYSTRWQIQTVGGRIVKESCPESLHHMQGDTHPKTGLPFSEEERKQLSALRPHNLLHNSEKDRRDIAGVSFPSGKASISDLNVQELKAMIIARGGSLTDPSGQAHRKEALQKLLEAFMAVEEQNSKHTVFSRETVRRMGCFRLLTPVTGPTLGKP